MNFILESVIYCLLFLFIWVSSFLWHELTHIISTGKLQGQININGLSMTASPATLWGGGIITGLIFVTAGCLMWLMQVPKVGYLFITCGVVNIFYGVFETYCLGRISAKRYLYGRYLVYSSTLFMMVMISIKIF